MEEAAAKAEDDLGVGLAERMRGARVIVVGADVLERGGVGDSRRR